ncbi:nucleotide sugar dehydrogenase [Halomarina litorea]|uniref:nucleotide sugar dehydrogenase n=1 Tax=Halomarina litorea TaxID=2961595 RepID=UPI0020C2A8B6|nr:nucleotide sugar dehydrogenase [Halomarina sp. BCD28]
MSSICVHGLGYIGLPTAAMLANNGHSVRGYDIDAARVKRLEEGESSIDEPGLDDFVQTAIESGALTVTTEIRPAEYHVICVPTPFDVEQREADLSYVRAASRTVRSELREGDTIILESTVPPGTTDTVIRPIVEESGLVAGDDFGLSYSPETVLPGNILEELRENDRIVGGISEESTTAAIDLYGSFVQGDIHTTADTTTAEFVKLIQNTFRDTNIALANELAKIARDHDIDAREAIRLANEHPRVDIHHPGPGVGGHCLPIDPWFLGQNSDELDLVSTARQVNDGMTEYIVELLRKELGALEGQRIAILGIAYKGNVDDIRNSPGLALARSLQSAGQMTASVVAPDGGKAGASIDIRLNDPHVNDQTLNLRPIEEATDAADAVVIATDHTEYTQIDPRELRERMDGETVLDTKALVDPTQWEAAGLDVVRL